MRSEIRSLQARVRALQRKYAPQLAFIKLRQLAEDYTLECEKARDEHKPQPETYRFTKKIVKPGSASAHSWPSTNAWTGSAQRTPSLSPGISCSPSFLMTGSGSTGTCPGSRSFLPSNRMERKENGRGIPGSRAGNIGNGSRSLDNQDVEGRHWKEWATAGTWDMPRENGAGSPEMEQRK